MVSGTVSFMNTVSTPPDGRATRWEQHNSRRRRELVESTLRAIRARGASVGLDEIAAQAGTSKTVLYRHFGDRAGLYEAVVEYVHDYIVSRTVGLLDDAERLDPAHLVRSLTDAYLRLVERDPEIYRFVVTRPPGGDPVADPVTGVTGRLGDELADLFRGWLKVRGLDPRPALTWGHGVVGFIWAVADKWITTGRQRPRPDIVEFTGRLFDPAFGSQGRVAAPADLAYPAAPVLLDPAPAGPATEPVPAAEPSRSNP